MNQNCKMITESLKSMLLKCIYPLAGIAPPGIGMWPPAYKEQCKLWFKNILPCIVIQKHEAGLSDADVLLITPV